MQLSHSGMCVNLAHIPIILQPLNIDRLLYNSKKTQTTSLVLGVSFLSSGTEIFFIFFFSLPFFSSGDFGVRPIQVLTQVFSLQVPLRQKHV